MFEFIGAAAVTVIALTLVHFVVWRLLRVYKSHKAQHAYIALLHQHSLVTNDELPYYARLAAADSLPMYYDDFITATEINGWQRIFMRHTAQAEAHREGLRAAVTDAITEIEESKPTS